MMIPIIIPIEGRGLSNHGSTLSLSCMQSCRELEFQQCKSIAEQVVANDFPSRGVKVMKHFWGALKLGTAV